MEYGNPSVLAAIIGGRDRDQGEIVEQGEIIQGDSNIRHDSFRLSPSPPSPSRSCYPRWILKRGELESWSKTNLLK